MAGDGGDHRRGMARRRETKVATRDRLLDLPCQQRALGRVALVVLQVALAATNIRGAAKAAPEGSS
jgi:hypothetical protein